jgi:putative hydrolase of the HAD superfamily
LRAVLFDFGGVILTSPFEAFAAYEERAGLQPGAIREINSNNPDSNAWARLERSEVGIEEFGVLFESEAAALGHHVSSEEVLGCLVGQVRPEMVTAIEHLRDDFAVALLTNNFVSGTPQWSRGGAFPELVDLFDVVIESSAIGCRKPEQRFYETALERLGVAAHEAVFLDDLGVNLKPAAAMGMRTIKVIDPVIALEELESIVGIPLG